MSAGHLSHHTCFPLLENLTSFSLHFITARLFQKLKKIFGRRKEGNRNRRSVAKGNSGRLGGSVSEASDVGSGHDLTAHELKTRMGLCDVSTQRALDPLSLSLSALPSLALKHK